MRMKAKQEFTYFLHGVDPMTFAKDEEFDSDDPELIEVSQREGWAAPAAETKPKTTRRQAASKE